MIRSSAPLCHIWLATVLLAASSFTAAQTSAPVFETTSSGLFTFSGQDRVIRVAAVFAQPDSALIETTVVFVNAQGSVLKQVRGDLRQGEPVVAELTRRDVGERPDVLVRVVVVHKLPVVREAGYPIAVTMQPISMDGFGRLLDSWNGGRCGCPCCGAPVGRGPHAYCGPGFPEVF